jgi:hypothetical protein
VILKINIFLYLFKQIREKFNLLLRNFIKLNKQQMKIKNLLLVALTVGALQLDAQIATPAASPTAKFEQKVGLTDVKIEYSRPSAKGRVVFGDAKAMVPYGEVWRTGANQISKISFSDSVTLDGNKGLKKGDYGILTKPGVDTWDVHFYKYTDGNWAGYTSKTPDQIVTVKSKKSANHTETFTIDLNDVATDMANLVITWEKTSVAVPIKVEVDKVVTASIDRVLAGPSANDYYTAGSYYHDSKKDLNKALEYVRKATSGASPAFWQVRKESLILADLGRYKEALEVAKKSLDLATKAGNKDYIKMNEESIAMWMKK